MLLVLYVGFLLASVTCVQSAKDGKCAWVEITWFTPNGFRVEYVAPNFCIPMSEELSRIITCVSWGLQYKEFFSRDCSGMMATDEKIKVRRRMDKFTTRDGIITDFDCSWARCRVDEIVDLGLNWTTSISRPGDKVRCIKSGEVFRWVSCVDDREIGAFLGPDCGNQSNAKQIEGEAAHDIFNTVSGFDCDGYGYVVEPDQPVSTLPAVSRHSFVREKPVEKSPTKQPFNVRNFVMILLFSIIGVALLARAIRFLLRLCHVTEYQKVSTLEADN